MTPIPDICPHCKSKEIDSAGKCQVCGHRVKEDKPTHDRPRRSEGGSLDRPINVEFSTSTEDQNPEMPEWRHELSRRLLEIKRKRGESPEPGPVLPAKTLPFPHLEQPLRIEAKPIADAPLITKASVGPATSSAAEPQDKIVRLPERNIARPQRAARKANAPLPLFQPARGKAGIKSASAEVDLRPIPKVTDPDPDQLQKLLDTIVLRQVDRGIASPQVAGANRKTAEEPGDKLILLSRTLSGLMDLLIVVLLAGCFILAADFFSGIEMIDNVSKAWYAALLLATYMLYSTFFLGTANQTIGMMIKDLRVVGERGERPKINQILLLSAGYLLSALALGLGLLWACFDRRSRCLHDRLSHTHIVRL